MTIIIFAASTLIDATNDELVPNPTRQCSKLYETLMSYVFPRSLTKVNPRPETLSPGISSYDTKRDFPPRLARVRLTVKKTSLNPKP